MIHEIGSGADRSMMTNPGAPLPLSAVFRPNPYEEDDCDVAGLPNPPRLWGPRRIEPSWGLGFDLPASLRVPSLTPFTPLLKGFTAHNDGSTTIEFDPVDLRPYDEVDLPEVDLVIGAAISESLQGTWTATSKNRDGMARGTLVVQVAERALTPVEFLKSRPA
jgi:hypothetical protein